MRQFFANTVAADTLPLKLVVYLGLLSAVLILLAQAWHATIPVLEDAQINDQIETASLSILSIQDGHARNSDDLYSPEGSMCTLKFFLPASIRYISFGVDPDPECDGNLSDSRWSMENNTIVYQHKNGVKERMLLEGKSVNFVKGELNAKGIWIPTANLKNNETLATPEKTGIVIEYPVTGEYLMELVEMKDIRYTMSHF
ncbi:MAG: hypothetical protein QG646_3921 [Euryarchaeota archaeon]|nr:hypothetical protein [Euryarchaeota archaeon]